MILITGVNGLLGSFLCNHLLEHNKKVVGLVREGADLSLLNKNHPELKLFTGNILDISSLISLFDTYAIEKVIHAAAIVSFSRNDRDKMERVNIEGTKNILNVCLTRQVKRFLFISSVAALGRTSTGKVDEETPWVNSSYNSFYGITKRAAELEVYRAQVEGLSTVIINPSLILAPADGNRSSSRFFSYLKKEPLFYPTGNLNYVDIRDVAEITEKILDADVQNERFIISAATISYKEFFQHAATLAGLKPPSIPVKKYMGMIAVAGESLLSKLLNRKPMLTSETLRTSKSMVSFDNKKILSFLDYQFFPLPDTIKWVWKQYNFQRRVEK
jgi:dihydroflavonol-4-reductase